jgi:hypothetical protein
MLDNEKYRFIKQISDPQSFLSEDARFVISAIDKEYPGEGLNVFFIIYDMFVKQRIMFSETEINALKKEFILQTFDGSNAKSLARKLRVSPSFVRRVLYKSRDRKRPPQ